MFERGGRLWPSTWPAPLFLFPDKTDTASLKKKKAAGRAIDFAIARSKRRAMAVTPLWLIASVWMWIWWLSSGVMAFMPLYILLTAAMLYEYAVMPTMFLFISFFAKAPPARIAPKGKKVAVIATCVPSQESMDVIENQLKSMGKIKYPHDSWILDEGGSPEIKRLARSYGVKYFTRKGIRKYNRVKPPFKAKTKAGNVNAWLDSVKYGYDFFVQFDVDHIPKPNYLHKTLGQFRDSKVAWVQAPSVYKNLEFWSSRGAAEQELSFQGPMQMGFYGFANIPFIIGSHCTYRMSAIKEIGGFQPTRAEDHLDTVTLASKGWNGVYQPEVIAEGDGPETLNTYLAQHFAWSYSMFQVFMDYTPKLIKGMPWKKKLILLFAQTWYPLWSLSYLVMWTIPILALFINHSAVNIKSTDLALHLLPVMLCTFLVWGAFYPLMRPSKLRISWRMFILHLSRWPAVLIAIINAATRVKKPYMITPKGDYARLRPSVRLYSPYLMVGFASCLAIVVSLFAYGVEASSGKVYFAYLNILFVLVICLLDLNIYARRVQTRLLDLKSDWLRPFALLTALVILSSSILISLFLSQKTPVFSLPISGHKTSSLSYIDLNQLPVQELSDKQLYSQLSKSAIISTNVPETGIYDPSKNFKSSDSYIRHMFVDWRDNRYIAEQLLISKRERATPLLTVQPSGEADGSKLLTDISNGKYDPQLISLSKTFRADTDTTVYVRFAHEMDLPNLYTWGNQDPQLFVTAYRHVIDLMRSNGATNVKWVWSPAGIQGVTDPYYPGDNYVDVVGTTVLYDRYWSGDYKPNFEELSRVRHWLTNYNKPVWITELGIGNTDPVYQAQLLSDAVTHYKEYGFSAMIYLNMRDANIKIPNYTYSNTEELLSTLGIRTKTAASNLAVRPIVVPKPKTSASQKTQIPSRQLSYSVNKF